MCRAPGSALNWRDNSVVQLERAEDLVELLGVADMVPVYGEKQHTASGGSCQLGASNVLYPDWRCKDWVELLPDGDLRMVEDVNLTARYSEFCLVLLAGDYGSGAYRIPPRSSSTQSSTKPSFTPSTNGS